MNLLEFYDSIGRVNRVLYPSPSFLSSVPTRRAWLSRCLGFRWSSFSGISFTIGNARRSIRVEFWYLVRSDGYLGPLYNNAV